jgi:uncharacterized protein YbjQ (UPF0145 family)
VTIELERRRSSPRTPDITENWYAWAQSWGISILGPLVGADKIRSVFDIGLAAAATLIGLMILLFLRRLGLFRLFSWLVRRKRPSSTPGTETAEMPESQQQYRPDSEPPIVQLATKPDKGLLLTTSVVPPSPDCILLGMVSGSAVLSRHLAADLKASLKNTVGGELKTYTRLLDAALSLATERLSRNAEALGADGVFGIQLGCPRISSGSAEILLVGTAYRVGVKETVKTQQA